MYLQGGDDANPYGSKEGAKHGMMLLDTLGLGDTILVAHSAGAPLAMKAARENPDRVKAIGRFRRPLHSHDSA